MEDEAMGMTKEMRNCQCLEIEERVFKAAETCIDLESKMQNRNKEFESLELKFKELESEKLVVEKELRNLKETEEDSLVEQMMVNKALEVEKHVAEKEAEEWKRKFEKLVETVRELDEIGVLRFGEIELDENVKLGLELASIKFPLVNPKTESCKDALNREGLANHQISGSPYITTPVKDYMSERNRDNLSSRRRVNKMLVFDGDGRESTDVVNLSHSKTEVIKEKESDVRGDLEETSISDNYEDEDVEACEVDTNATLPGRKRKRVITSDSENDDDDEDNIPIATLKNLKPQNHEMSDLVDGTPTICENESGGLGSQRRVSSRLRKKRVLEEISTSTERNLTERLVGIPITGKDEDDETEEESESESLDGFIVDDEPASEEPDDTEGNVLDDESDGETGYADVISRLRRDKKKPGEQKWEYEADMLAAFGKNDELCMRAVCVLYMFQTEGEKASRSSYVANGRGFSMYDAERGTCIGEFLTDGDPSGDLKKSVEELESFMFNAVEICRDLASRYSKQLFQVYRNREVPFFAAAPSP